MACCCNCDRYVNASSVAVTSELTEDYLTITVPATYTFEEGNMCIGLNTTIPNTISCARVVVTNGTDTVEILKGDGNYWRPCRLRCHSTLRLRYLADPAHLLIRG